jgi:hypothetical protein
VDLPAAIFPQKNINFAEFFWPILDKKYHGLTAKSRLVAKPDEWLIVPTWDVTPLIGTLQEQTHLRCHREVPVIATLISFSGDAHEPGKRVGLAGRAYTAQSPDGD